MFNYIVDSHCHLDLIEEKGLTAVEAVKAAQENDVKILQTICTRITEIDKILAYANQYENVYASVGIHPCNVTEQPKVTADEIVEIGKNPKIIGIGETGLDYFHDVSAIPLQKEMFLQHIKASQQSKLPLIIHSRDTDKDMAEILESEKKNADFPALLHCFSSSEELARKALDLGIFISISGIVTFKNAKILQEIVKFVPIESLLVETDSPYLAPMPHRGKMNQPAYTRFVAEFIAELKGIPLAQVMDKTTENFFRIFTKAWPIT